MLPGKAFTGRFCYLLLQRKTETYYVTSSDMLCHIIRHALLLLQRKTEQERENLGSGHGHGVDNGLGVPKPKGI